MNDRVKVLFYIPNLIGYIRLALICIAWKWINIPNLFLLFYATSALLDVVDGWAARKFRQVSDFGAWLDVIVDVIGRGVLWCHLGKYGYAVPAWEWLVFVANHAQAGSGQWREQFNDAPLIVRRVMSKGFKTFLGGFVISGIHVFPIWLYAEQSYYEIIAKLPVISSCVFWTLLCGRLLGFAVEAWCIYAHIFYLTGRHGSDGTKKAE